MPDPIIQSIAGIDQGARYAQSTTVVGSPAAASETVVATTPQFPAGYNPTVVNSIVVAAQVAFTVGTSGTAVTYRIRQGTTTAGTVVFNSGAITSGIAAAALVIENIFGVDVAPGALPAQQYSLTLTVTAGAATSTVSAVVIYAYAI